MQNQTGKQGENIAANFLKKHGYLIKELNYRCPVGEVDIIATDKKTLVFVEVKTRCSNALGFPEEAVGPKKQKKLSQLALWYMQQKKLFHTGARFDVVAVTFLPESSEVKLIKNAFDFIES